MGCHSVQQKSCFVLRHNCTLLHYCFSFNLMILLDFCSVFMSFLSFPPTYICNHFSLVVHFQLFFYLDLLIFLWHPYNLFVNSDYHIITCVIFKMLINGFRTFSYQKHDQKTSRKTIINPFRRLQMQHMHVFSIKTFDLWKNDCTLGQRQFQLKFTSVNCQRVFFHVPHLLQRQGE